MIHINIESKGARLSVCTKETNLLKRTFGELVVPEVKVGEVQSDYELYKKVLQHTGDVVVKSHEYGVTWPGEWRGSPVQFVDTWMGD